MSASKPGKIPVLDFDKGEVRYVTPEEAKAERDELCRSQGHMFATRHSHPIQTGDRCMCGDISFEEWGK